MSTGQGGKAGPEVTITVCPNGPLLVRGGAVLRDVDGEAVVHDRNVIALCRCGRSASKPLCDGSHRLSRFRDDTRAPEMTRTLGLGGGTAAPASPPDPVV